MADDKKYRIAVASSDGIVVNRHFGRADTFYVYDVSDDGKNIELYEIRHVEPVCQGGNHDEAHMAFNANEFKDCTHVIVSKIGMGAANALEKNGVIPMELPGIIEESIQKLIIFEQIQALF